MFLEKLLESGYGVRAEGRKAAEILGESTESVVTRKLSNKRKGANKRGLTFIDIIRENHLKFELKELLLRASMTKEESFF